MKKVSLTFRVPMFVDVELEMEDLDYENLIDEWDRLNVGRVNSVLSNYVDLENLSLSSVDERIGNPELVDLRVFEDFVVEADDTTEDIDALDYCNTIEPKGKPN